MIGAPCTLAGDSAHHRRTGGTAAPRRGSPGWRVGSAVTYRAGLLADGGGPWVNTVLSLTNCQCPATTTVPRRSHRITGQALPSDVRHARLRRRPPRAPRPRAHAVGEMSLGAAITGHLSPHRAVRRRGRMTPGSMPSSSLNARWPQRGHLDGLVVGLATIGHHRQPVAGSGDRRQRNVAITVTLLVASLVRAMRLSRPRHRRRKPQSHICSVPTRAHRDVPEGSHVATT